MRAALTALLATLALLAPGCVTVHAALQSAEGELALLSARKPIAEVISSARTPPRLRALLARIAQVKRFGEENGLRATGSYEDYVALPRPAVVYVVSACERLRFVSKTWSFPIAGSFPYLGWFDLRSARDYAKSLEGEGLDVDVRGAQAYSTLGWFDDPVLSSMIAPGPEALGDLANVVLHESLHATLHIQGQAPFNESLASFVADTLTPRYLGAESPRAREAWEAQQRRNEAQAQALHEAALSLSLLYATALPDAEKLARKAALLAALEEKLHARRHINNATLAQHRTYSAGNAGFARVLAACSGDVRCFLRRVSTLTPESFSKPQQDDLDPVLLPLANPPSQ